MVKIGDKVNRRLYTGRINEVPCGEVGTVIYINEEKGWYLVEFDFDGIKLTECYYMEDETECSIGSDIF